MLSLTRGRAPNGFSSRLQRLSAPHDPGGRIATGDVFADLVLWDTLARLRGPGHFPKETARNRDWGVAGGVGENGWWGDVQWER